MREPPSEPGVVHDTDAPPSMAVAVTAVGAPGLLILAGAALADTLTVRANTVAASNIDRHRPGMLRSPARKQCLVRSSVGFILSLDQDRSCDYPQPIQTGRLFPDRHERKPAAARSKSVRVQPPDSKRRDGEARNAPA